MFSDLGSTALSAHMDPEDLREGHLRLVRAVVTGWRIIGGAPSLGDEPSLMYLKIH